MDIDDDDNLSQDLNALAEKRRVLEELISYAQQISRASKGLDAIKQIIKPSQLPSAQERQFIHKLMKHLKDLKDNALKKSLQSLDDHIRFDLKIIMEISGLDRAEFVKRLQEASQTEIKMIYEELQDRLKEFRRRAQTNVAIRLELYDRGVQISAANLGIGQEEILEKLESVKQKEAINKQLVKHKMQTYIDDIDVILNNSNYSDAVKQKFLDAKVGVAQTLDDLNTGKDMEDISNIIEPVDMGAGFFGGVSDPDDIVENIDFSSKSLNKSSEDQVKAEAPIEKIETEKQKTDVKPKQKKNKITTPTTTQDMIKQHGFFKVLYYWLKTPMHVTWDDIKDRLEKGEKI